MVFLLWAFCQLHAAQSMSSRTDTHAPCRTSVLPSCTWYAPVSLTTALERSQNSTLLLRRDCSPCLEWNRSDIDLGEIRTHTPIGARPHSPCLYPPLPFCLLSPVTSGARLRWVLGQTQHLVARPAPHARWPCTMEVSLAMHQATTTANLGTAREQHSNCE